MQQEDFDACLSDINLENDILEDVMNAQKEFNIRSTPSFIINGELYAGNLSGDKIDEILESYIN